MKKRMLALLLALAMVIAMCPVPASAAATQATPRIISGETVTYHNPLYPGVSAEEELALNSAGNETQALSDVEYVSAAQATAAVRTQLEQRNESFTVYVETDADYSALGKQMFHDAMAHTGVPTQGDYLMWQWGDMGVSMSGSVSGDVYYIAYTYTVVYYTTASQEAAMDAAVSSVLSELDLGDATDYEKICGIYDYICDHVTYDYANLGNESYTLQYTAYAALINGTSVCQGYANLFYRLALELGVDNRIVTGTSSGGGHAWNIVKLGGSYYNVDATWDAVREEYDYFLKSDESFSADHTRDEEYASETFYADYSMGEADYAPAETVAEGTCGENLTWILDSEGTLTISGTGAMADYASSAKTPWYSYRSTITGITIGEGVTTVGQCAFASCTAAENVTLPATLTSIGTSAFYNCQSLTFVEVPGGVTGIGAGAFKECTALTTAVIPGTVSVLPDELFRECTSLESVILSEGIEIIQELVFYRCGKLKSVAIPASVSEIGDINFYYCTALESITVAEGSVSFCNDEYGVLYNADKTELICCPAAFAGVYEIPESVTSTRKNAFDHCTGLTSVTIPASLTELGDGTFSYCTGLTTVEIPAGVTVLPYALFSYCTGLTGVTLPNTLKTVGNSAFTGCSALKDITLPAGLESLENGAFYGCSSLESMVIPEGITELPLDLFRNCISLTGVTIPASVNLLDSGVFCGCSSLESIVIPDGVAVIPGETFKNCSSLTAVTLPDSIVMILTEAFRDCDSLTQITIPDTVTSIDTRAFYGCGNLTKVNLCAGNPGKVTLTYLPTPYAGIGVNAFYSCSMLTEMHIPAGCVGIGEGAFQYCSALTELELHENIENIDDKAFLSSGIQTLRFTGTAPTFSSAAFQSITATAYYPHAWSEDVLQNYGGTITWVFCCSGDHTYTSVVTAPTCTEQGYTTHTCTVCGDSYVDSYTDALGHDYGEWIVTKEATCEENGQQQHTCTRCGAVETEEIPGGHSYQNAVTSPTCTEQGYTTHTCTVCGDSYVDSYTDALGHDYGGWIVTKEATCEENGQQQHTCTRCGAVEMEEIPGDHSYQNVVTAPTCTEQGYTTHTCTVCGDSYVDSYTDALGHDYGEWIVTKEATCTENGEQYRSCSFCGSTETETIGAVGHSYQDVVTAPTCTEQGYTTHTCTVCGDSYVNTYVDALGHNYVNGTCTICGEAVLKITKQPTDVTVAAGQVVTVTFEAAGEDLTYTWYVKDVGSDWVKSSITKEYYSFAMTAAKSGRQVYCVVTDKYNNSVTTETVTVSMATLKITKQPTDVTVGAGQVATVTFEAAGEDLTYTWYVKDVGSDWKKSSITDSSYSFAMTAAKAGRQVYCVVMDKYNNSVTTETVTVSMATLKITQQPVSVTVAEGETATVTVGVSGTGELTYQWYWAAAGSSSFLHTTTFTGNTYFVEMNSTRNGRQLYCVISDSYGNSVTTDTVTINMSSALKITQQPTDVTVAAGQVASTTVTASGEGLSYTWYVLDSGSSAWVKSSITKSTYSFAMSAAKSGRHVYCVVTDASGKSVKTDIVTMNMTTDIKITQQPTDVAVAAGQLASTTVTASGNGLSYTWYVLDPGSSAWVKSSITTSTYSFTMTAAKSGRQVYCVITDANGNRVATKISTMKAK